MNIENKLKELNITLPKAALPAANYVPYLVDNKTIYISGQLPMQNGKIAYQGKIGTTAKEASSRSKTPP